MDCTNATFIYESRWDLIEELRGLRKIGWTSCNLYKAFKSFPGVGIS